MPSTVGVDVSPVLAFPPHVGGNQYRDQLLLLVLLFLSAGGFVQHSVLLQIHQNSNGVHQHDHLSKYQLTLEYHHSFLFFIMITPYWALL